MRAVGQRDTGPELKLRKMLHALGYRYRISDTKLPGRPDIVFPSRKKVIFVHGCYWHGHDCKYGRLPKSNVSYWHSKVRRNKARDAKNVQDLEYLGWKSFVVWQCDLKNPDNAVSMVEKFLK